MERLIERVKSKAKRLFGVATWILAVLLLISTAKNISRVAGVKNAVEKEKERVEKMREENAQIEAQIAMSQSSDFIEKQIRDKLGLAKTGESIVVLPDADTLRKLAPQIPVEQDSLPDPNWKKWLKLFL